MKCEICGSDDILLYTYCEDGKARSLRGLCRTCKHEQIKMAYAFWKGWNPSGRRYP